jgi:hypothetical protein
MSEPRGFTTSVNGRNYVLHIKGGAKTLCGRLAQLMNCDAGTATDEELCRSCRRKRDREPPSVTQSPALPRR